MTWLTPDPGGHPAERLRALLAAEQTLIVPGVFHGLSALLARRAGAEAIYLSDRVFVFSRRPAVIALELVVDIAYPRSQRTRFLEQFTELEKRAGIALGVVKQ